MYICLVGGILDGDVIVIWGVLVWGGGAEFGGLQSKLSLVCTIVNEVGNVVKVELVSRQI